MKKPGAPSASAALAALAAIWLVAPVARAEPPVIEIEKMTFVSSKGEVNELVLESDRAVFDTATETAELERVEASVSEGSDHEAFEMRCDEGTLDLASNDFHARGHVVGRTESGREFSADWVKYDHAQGLLYTDAPVLITESSGRYRGGGFRYFVRERRFMLLGGAVLVQEEG